MRRCRRSLLVLAIALAMAVPAALGDIRDHEDEGGVRGFHGEAVGGITRSFDPDHQAQAELDRILTAIGLKIFAKSITLRATAQTRNAAAAISQKTGERFIFYNASFMVKLTQKTDDWSLVSILAHELGHHLGGHTLADGHAHKFELQADYFSGFVLRRLGATLAQAEAAMQEISPDTPGRTHPGRADRVQMITLGWIDGVSEGPPRGVKGIEVPPPEAQATKQPSWTEVATFCKEVAGITSVATLQALAGTHKATPMAACVQARINELKKQNIAVAPPPPEPKPVPPPQPAPSSRCDGVEASVGTWPTEPGTGAIATVSRRIEMRCLKAGDTFRDCADCPVMVVVPAGSFTRGSPPEEIEKNEYLRREGPQRRVTIARPFAVGKFEVTFAEWDACFAAGGCRHHPEGQDRGRRPVINVSWSDVMAEYLPWLLHKTSKVYRLLSEAEWEYTARAGTTTRYYTGQTISKSQANFSNQRWGTVDVGSYPPNAFGLYDMHGNVWEWVEDCWNKTYDGAPSDGSAWAAGDCRVRVVRGGDWNYPVSYLRSASRESIVAHDRGLGWGFRVARRL